MTCRLILMLLIGALGPAPASAQTVQDDPGRWLGPWCLLSWQQSNPFDNPVMGELVLEAGAPSGLPERGRLEVRVIDGDSYAIQSLSIEDEGPTLFARGTLLESRNWWADNLRLSLEGDILHARGPDDAENMILATFRRGACANELS